MVYMNIGPWGPRACTEQLLRATGSASAETIARQTLGIDLQSKQFWNESIDLIERDLAALEAIEH